jgi:hypothetical protein
MAEIDKHVVRVYIQARFKGTTNGGIRSTVIIGPTERLSSPETFVAPLIRERGDGPMASLINRLRMQTLRGQIEASRLESVALADKFDSAPTQAEKARIARQIERALKQTHALQHVLESMERKERESASKS